MEKRVSMQRLLSGEMCNRAHLGESDHLSVVWYYMEWVIATK